MARMGIHERDWYRDEVARRKRPPLGGRAPRLGRLVTMAAVAMTALLVLPAATSTCDLNRWQTMPAACLQQSWEMLLRRIGGAPAHGECGYYVNRS